MTSQKIPSRETAGGPDRTTSYWQRYYFAFTSA